MNNQPSIDPVQVATATLGIMNRADIKVAECGTATVCADFLQAIISGKLEVKNTRPATTDPRAEASTDEAPGS